MQSTARRILIGVACLVVGALAFDGLVGVAQPSFEGGDAEGVLRTYDEDGGVQESRLVVIDDGGTLWIQSGHHFRGWYHRLLRNPDVELVRGGEVKRYHAVPIDTPESEARVREILKERIGVLPFYLTRAILLFADMKPVRLDPLDESDLSAVGVPGFRYPDGAPRGGPDARPRSARDQEPRSPA